MGILEALYDYLSVVASATKIADGRKQVIMHKSKKYMVIELSQKLHYLFIRKRVVLSIEYCAILLMTINDQVSCY